MTRLSPGPGSSPAEPKAVAVMAGILPRVSSVIEGRSKLSVPLPEPLKSFDVGLYQPWAPSMDEGWTRLVLEQFDFEYATLHDTDIRAGRLIDRFGTIILPSVTARAIREGQRPNETEPAYVGGLGPAGVDSLRDFVRRGGKLICLEDSCQFAIEAFGLPIKDVLRDLKTSEFYAPGSVIRAHVAPELVDKRFFGQFHHAPLVFGLPATFSAYFDRSLAFEVTDASVPITMPYVVARYAALDPLESGWLLGAEKLQGKAAIVVAPVGDGSVTLFGFPPQHRGQPHGDVPPPLQCHPRPLALSGCDVGENRARPDGVGRLLARPLLLWWTVAAPAHLLPRGTDHAGRHRILRRTAPARRGRTDQGDRVLHQPGPLGRLPEPGSRLDRPVARPPALRPESTPPTSSATGSRQS